MSENSYSWIGTVAIAAAVVYGIYTLRDWFGSDRGLGTSGFSAPLGIAEDAYLPTSQSSPVNRYISKLPEAEKTAVVQGNLSGQSSQTQAITAGAYTYDLYHPSNKFGVLTSGWNNPALDVQVLGTKSSGKATSFNTANILGVTKSSSSGKVTVNTKKSITPVTTSSKVRSVDNNLKSYAPSSTKAKVNAIISDWKRQSIKP